MKFFLIVAKGKKQGMPIPVEVDLFLIGSGPMCQLRAVHDKIGEQHCALVIRDRKKIFISHLDEDFATLVNGEVMEPGMEWPLHSGDVIEVGPLKFMMQYREKILSQRDMEEWALSCLDHSSSVENKVKTRASEEFHSEEYEAAASAAAAILDGLTAQRGVVKGRLRISRDGDVTIVRVNDVYLVDEAELAHIKKEFYDHLSHNNLRVLIDMKHVKRMSTPAAEMLSELRTWLRPHGSRMAICRLRPDFVTMLHAFPNTQDIPVFGDKPKALTSRW